MSEDVAGVNEELKAEVRLFKSPFPDMLDDVIPVDEAMWALGKTLGVYPPDPDFSTFRKRVGGMWVNSQHANGLYDCLTALYKAGVLTRIHRAGHDYEFSWGLLRDEDR